MNSKNYKRLNFIIKEIGFNDFKLQIYLKNRKYGADT